MSNLTKESTMSDAQFWSIVKELGWGTRTTDYKAILKALVKLWDVSNATDFRNTFDKLQMALKRRIEQWEDRSEVNLGIGDDSFDDLTAHIIGLGKREYDAVMQNPQLAYDRAQAPYGSKEGYRESFAYAIPHEVDFR